MGGAQVALATSCKLQESANEGCNSCARHFLRFYRAMHFSAYARSWDRMSSVRLSVCL